MVSTWLYGLPSGLLQSCQISASMLFHALMYTVAKLCEKQGNDLGLGLMGAGADLVCRYGSGWPHNQCWAQGPFCQAGQGHGGGLLPLPLPPASLHACNQLTVYYTTLHTASPSSATSSRHLLKQPLVFVILAKLSIQLSYLRTWSSCVVLNYLYVLNFMRGI